MRARPPRRNGRWRLVEKHDTATAIQFDEQNAGIFQGAPHEVARRVVDRQVAVRLDALDGGQRHQGFFGEHILLPVQQGSRRPHLLAGDHS